MGALEAAGKVSVQTWMPELRSWIGKRDVALLTLLYVCGLRLGEALSLKRADLAGVQGGRLVVTGKVNRQRVVPVLPIVADVLAEYVGACPYSHLGAALTIRGLCRG
jgi:integrase/recombinase XerC